jgi:hypothetical protein
MRLGFTNTHLNPNSGQKPVVQHQRGQGRFHQQKRSWHVYWDAEGILLIDYLEKGKSITGEYFFLFLTRVDEKICEKRPGFQKKKIIFYQDSAPAHKSVLAMGKLGDLHYKLLEHPPYSPDLAPSLTSISSQNANSSSLVSVFLRMKKRLQL